jgi:hypothetical protein
MGSRAKTAMDKGDENNHSNRDLLRLIIGLFPGEAVERLEKDLAQRRQDAKRRKA